MADNAAIVTAFCKAFDRIDPDELIAYFTDDAVYHNVPMTPYVGRRAIYDAFKGMAERTKSIRFEILHQVAQGDVVMNERIDHIPRPDGTVRSLPLVGVFELQRGKIKAWRDYFDRGAIQPSS